jgi:hypothetical protein
MLEQALHEISFVRKYALGFFCPGIAVDDDAPIRRYRVHSCMGHEIASGQDVWLLESSVPLRCDVPVVVKEDNSELLYLWPMLLQRHSDRLQRRTLYMFEKIPEPDNVFGYLSRLTATAIDHDDEWTTTLCETGAADHQWLFSRLQQEPLRQSLPAEMRDANVAHGIAFPTIGGLEGQTLGKHSETRVTLECAIAKGGFGTVYQGRTGDGRYVAVKVLETGAYSHLSQRHVRRFRQEFNKLQNTWAEHPSIVQCYEFGIDVLGRREYCWYSMELASHDLTVRLRQRQREIAPGKVVWNNPEMQDEVVEEYTAIVDAVAFLHTRDVIHRDIKPANILVVDQRLKLSDFGLVKDLSCKARSESASTSHPLSSEGGVLGTQAYMAPEQAEGGIVTLRSDVYSLGVVLAELAIGTRPERDMTVPAGSPIENDSGLGKLPFPLRQLIVRCTSKDPNQRPEDANHLKQLFAKVVANRRHRQPAQARR